MEAHSSPSISYFLEEAGQGWTGCVFLCHLESQQGHSFMASLVSFSFLLHLEKSIHAASARKESSAPPTLPHRTYDCNLSSFALKSRCAQGYTSLERPLQSLPCHLWPPWHPCDKVCSQGFCLWRVSHPFLSCHKDLCSIARNCRVRISSSGEFNTSVLFSMRWINTRQDLHHLPPAGTV